MAERSLARWSTPSAGTGYMATVAASEHPTLGALGQRVVGAVGLTVEAGSARMQHGSRVGAADGPAPTRRRPGEGWIDLRRRRAWYPDVRALGGEDVAAEQFWDGSTLYVRFSADEPWAELPLIRRSEVPGASVPYSSPWWLLDALCGARDDAQIVGDEDIRGTATTHIRLTVDTSRAVMGSPSGLRLPGRDPDAFPAEVWLDRDGRLRRMGCTWPRRRRIPLGKWQPYWITTEFWDFGTAVESPAPPKAGETIDPPRASVWRNASGESWQIGSDPTPPGDTRG
jgi:hypothetical protein